MDKAIKKRFITKKKILIAIPLLILLGFFVKFIVFQEFNPVYRIKTSEIMISTVTEQEISQTIQTIGLIEPVNRISIETGEEGQIVEILQKSGALVKTGDPLIRLVNENLENEYTSLSQSILEQKQQSQLNKEEFKSREIDFRDSLLELDYKIKQLEKTVANNQKLHESGSITNNQLISSEKEYTFWIQKKDLFLEKWENEQKVQISKENMFKLGMDSLLEKQNIFTTRMERLVLKSPGSGVLSLEDIAIGQSLEKQQKIAMIDIQGHYKMTAGIDEFYLSDLHIGDMAHFTIKGEENSECLAELSFISPEVEGSKVQLEFTFASPLPSAVISGQSFNIKIFQENPVLKTVIEYGSFYKESAGNWIYRLDKNTAEKTPISTGIKNSDYIEILTGLEIGDRVIVSNYKKYMNYDKLILEEI